MQTLAVVVTTPPHNNLTTTAIDYVTCAIKSGVKITGVFFYQDGVLNAAQHLSLANDEYQTLQQWKLLNEQHALSLYLCVTAGEKRGLSDDVSNTQDGSNIDKSFILSGLGELVELTVSSDRVVQF